MQQVQIRFHQKPSRWTRTRAEETFGSELVFAPQMLVQVSFITPWEYILWNRCIPNCFDGQHKVGGIYFGHILNLGSVQTRGSASWDFYVLFPLRKKTTEKSSPSNNDVGSPCADDMTILLKRTSPPQNVNLLNKSQIPRSKVLKDHSTFYQHWGVLDPSSDFVLHALWATRNSRLSLFPFPTEKCDPLTIQTAHPPF